MNFLEYVRGKKILHVSHSKPDCDAVASVYWGIEFFGGDYYFHDVTSNKVLALMEYLQLDPDKEPPPDTKDFDLVIVYDTERRSNVDYIDLDVTPYVIFDHHPRETEFVRGAVYSYKIPNSATVVNLYNFSIENGIDLLTNEKVRFAFAVALYSDTIALKTARENELKLLGELLGNRKVGDILDLFSRRPIRSAMFIKDLTSYREMIVSNYRIGVIETNGVEDGVHVFVDGLFYPFGLDLLIAVTPMGLKFHVKKVYVQKIYHKVLVKLEKEWGIRRDHGIWVGFYDVDRLIEELHKRM